jgi:surface-anchored protein
MYSILNRNPLQTALALAAGAQLLMAIPSQAQPVLTSGHADVGVGYDLGAWDLHVHDEESNTEYEPGEVVLGVGETAFNTVPANPAFSFLGTAGSPIWVLPSAENPELLFLGLGTEELAPGLFVNNQVQLSLVNVSGPGDFFLYELNFLGAPLVRMNSRDGYSSTDAMTLLAGSHKHANWVFSALGDYEVTFQASGILDDGLNTLSLSDPVTYQFTVVPEPGALALFALGGGLWLLRRSRAV